MRIKAYITIIMCIAILIMGVMLSVQEPNKLLSNTMLWTSLVASISGMVVAITILVESR